MLLTLIVLVVIVGLSVPAALVFIPLAVATGDVRPLYAVACGIARAGFQAAGIRIETTGLERVPRDRACIFMANHVSNLDPPALVSLIPGRTAAFSKRAVFDIPVFGYALRLGDFIPVERMGNTEAAQASVEAAKRVLAKGVHITTFVEGTRSRDGRMLPFKKGPFYLAKESGAPCVPVSIYGSEALMAKGSLGIRPGTVHIAFHEPVLPEEHATREELMQAVRAAIASGLPEWMR